MATLAPPLTAAMRFRDLGPFGDFVAEHGVEPIRRPADEAIAQRRLPLPSCRESVKMRAMSPLILAMISFGVPLGANRAYQLGFVDEADAELVEGGNVGKLRGARAAGHRQGPHLAALDVADGAAERRDPERDAAGDHIGHGLAVRRVRHVLDLDAGEIAEQRGREMSARADAERGIVQIARMRLGVIDQLA